MADAKILSLIQQQLKMTSGINRDLADSVVKELLQSESIVDSVFELFRQVREERNSIAAQKLMNLMQLLNTEYVAVNEGFD